MDTKFNFYRGSGKFITNKDGYTEKECINIYKHSEHPRRNIKKPVNVKK